MDGSQPQRRPPPDVTVVIPTRDRPALLRRTLQSVARQNGVTVEVVVVDDGSSTTLALREAPGGLHVRVLRHERPRGVAAARNTGVFAATAPHVAFLDDDDLWAPDKLRLQLSALDAGQRFAYTGVHTVDATLRVVDPMYAPDPGRLLRGLLQRNVVPAGASNVLAETRLIRDLGGFDVRLAHLADWDCWIRLAAAAPGAAVPRFLTAYVQHEANWLVTDQGGIGEEFRLLARKHRALFVREGVEPDRHHFRRWRAAAYRRRGSRWPAAGLYLANAIEFRSPGDVARAAVAIAGRRPRSTPPGQEPAPPWLVDARRLG